MVNVSSSTISSTSRINGKSNRRRGGERRKRRRLGTTVAPLNPSSRSMNSPLSLSPLSIPHQSMMQSPSIAASSCTSAGGSGTINEAGVAGGGGGVEFPDESWAGIQKLASDLEALVYNNLSADYSDAHILISKGVSVPVHRCILAARSPFFARVFAELQQRKEEPEISSKISKPSPGGAAGNRSVEVDLSELVGGAGKVGKQTLLIVLGYFYGGKLRRVEDECAGVTCMDSKCPHSACWPVIEYYLELLFAGSVFQVWELKSVAMEQLMKLVPKAQAENVLQIMAMASAQLGCEQLVEISIPVVAKSNLPALAVEKTLSVCNPRLAVEVADVRKRLGLHQVDVAEDKLCRRVYKSLDSDDIELMNMLLNEASVNVDTVYALHYAASYCDVKTFGELLELGTGDVNLRDRYGYTVLHAATFRRIPEVVGLVLSKGASPLDATPDGFTALQLSRRIARNIESVDSAAAEAREDWLRDRICVEILEQAENVNPTPVFPVVGEKELFMRLLYLENRVAFARLLWPREAKVVLGLSQLEGTKELTADETSLMDLNKEPSGSCMNETLVQRVNALQRAIEVGHRFFPRCTEVLNKFMDDGSFEHACIQNRRLPEQQLLAKRKRVTEDKELKDRFAEAFQRDVEEQNKQRGCSTAAA